MLKWLGVNNNRKIVEFKSLGNVEDNEQYFNEIMANNRDIEVVIETENDDVALCNNTICWTINKTRPMVE